MSSPLPEYIRIVNCFPRCGCTRDPFCRLSIVMRQVDTMNKRIRWWHPWWALLWVKKTQFGPQNVEQKETHD